MISCRVYRYRKNVYRSDRAMPLPQHVRNGNIGLSLRCAQYSISYALKSDYYPCLLLLLYNIKLL